MGSLQPLDPMLIALELACEGAVTPGVRTFAHAHPFIPGECPDGGPDGLEFPHRSRLLEISLEC